MLVLPRTRHSCAITVPLESATRLEGELDRHADGVDTVCGRTSAPKSEAEALTNVTKYARASTVRVAVAATAGKRVVDASDEGVGGADAATGSGLRGLADRVEALGGSLAVVN